MTIRPRFRGPAIRFALALALLSAAAGVPAESILQADFTAGGGGWTGGVSSGAVVLERDSRGLCMTVPAGGDNVGGWVSPERYIPLRDLTIYRLKLTVSAGRIAPDSIPFLNVVYNNYNSGGGGNNFGGEAWFLDVQGGANAPGAAGGLSEITLYIAPNAALTDQWRGAVDLANSAFTTEADAVNDIALLIRVLDLASANINAGFDEGGICVSSLSVEALAFTAFVTEGTVYYPDMSPAKLAAEAPGQGGGGWAVIEGSPAAAHYQLTASGAGSRRSLYPFDPEQDNFVNFNRQLYPATWRTGVLYMGTVAIRSDIGYSPAADGAAPKGTGEGIDPVDSIFLIFDVPTVELGQTHYSTRGAPGNMLRAASPRLAATTGGAAMQYIGFFHGQQSTLSGETDAGRLRMYAEFFNTPDIGPEGAGADPFAVDFIAVERMTPPN